MLHVRRARVDAPATLGAEFALTLDLVEILGDWNDRENSEVVARLVRGRDNQEVLHLRVDLGLMQLLLNGRPDGARYHGMTTALDYLEHELRVDSGRVRIMDWHALLREINQLNYRRLALAAVADDMLAANHGASAARMLTGAIRDIDFCLSAVDLLERERGEALEIDDESLRPTLVYQRYRALVQLRVTQARYGDAIDSARAGADRLAAALAEIDLSDDEVDRDDGLCDLRRIERQLRSDYEIPATLRERLAAALEAEDFDEAAELRDELTRTPPLEAPGEFGRAVVI